MKKLVKSVFTLSIVAAIMTSCYTTKTYHGAAKIDSPMVEVMSKKNTILLWGLLPMSDSKQQVTDVIGNDKDYQVQVQQSFVDGVLSTITFGIYTPYTTTYYLPVKK